jgi:GST-like protein|tara:strand:+ start:3261 stop:4157 length:897 start_codon:yes stop_codon:yes gene_type:complete
MSETAAYAPAKVWTWNKEVGGKFAAINRPTAGASHEQALPVGKHPLQLYSLGTPNGVKVTVLLEELVELGIIDAEYDAWLINIQDGEQFSSGFVEVNPNSKIPALLDHSTTPPTRVFESGAIMLYLAERFDAFIPKSPAQRVQCLNWLFWNIGSVPFLGGGFGHFYAYAPEKLEYPIERYTMEVKRQLHLLDQHLADNRYLCGDEYSIADMANMAWYGALVMGKLYEAAEFLDATSYKNVIRWTQDIQQRPAVKRGQRVNRVWGAENHQLAERHDASDFDKDPAEIMQQMVARKTGQL